MANGNGNDTPKWEDTVEIQDAPSWDDTEEISQPQGTGFQEAFSDPSVRALEESGASLQDVLAQADAISTPFVVEKSTITPTENIQNALNNLPLAAELGSQQAGTLFSKAMESMDEALGFTSSAAAEDVAQMKGAERIQELKGQMKPTVGIVSAIKQGDSNLLLSSILASAVDVVRSAGEGAVSGGILPVAELIGASYTEATEEKARALGVAPEVLMMQDEEDVAVPLVIGTVAGALEKYGLKGVSKNFSKYIPIDQATRTLIGTSTKEGLTEWIQFGLEEANKELARAEDDSQVDLTDVIGRAMGSEEGLNALAAGVAGSGVLGGTGQAVRRTLTKKAKGEQVSDQELDIALADGDADVAQNVKDVTEGLQELSEEADSTVEQDQISESDQEQQVETEQEQIPQLFTEEEADTQMEKIAANSLDLFEQQAAEDAISPDIKSQEAIRDEAVNKANKLADESVKLMMDKADPANLDAKSKKAYDKVMEEIEGGDAKSKLQAYEQFNIARSEAKFKEISGKVKKNFSKAGELYRQANQEVGNIRTYLNLVTGFDIRTGSQIMENIGLGNLTRASLNYIQDTNAETKAFQDVVTNSKATWEDAVKVGIYGHIMGRYGREGDGRNEIQENLDNLYRSAYRKRDKGEKNAVREIELIDEALDRLNKGEQILDTEASRAMMESVKKFNDKEFGNTQLLYKTFFDKEIPYVYDYVPRRAVGFENETPNTVSGDLMTELEKGEVKRKPKAKVYESSFSFDRQKDIGNATYELDITKVFPDHIKSVMFDKSTVPSFSVASKVLGSKEVEKAFGRKNVDAMAEYLRGYIAMSRGRKMSTLLKQFNKMKNMQSAVILGMPDQIVKQGLPAILQTAGTNPKQTTRAAIALSKVNDDWFKKYAPELLLRKEEISRFQEDRSEDKVTLAGQKYANLRKKAKKGIQNSNNWALQLGDNFAARLVFMTDLMERNKDRSIADVINDPGADKVRDAIGVQESLQNVSSIEFAGNLFTSPKQGRMVLSKTLFALTNFALNQTLNLVNSLGNLDKKDGRKIASQAAIGALVYPAITVALAEMWDEAFDFFREDEEEEKIEGFTDPDLYDKMGRAVAMRGLFDATIGNIPMIGATGVDSRLEQLNEAVTGKEYSWEDKLFYDEDMMDLFGPTGGYFDIIKQGTSNAIESMTEDDEDKAQDLAMLSAVEFYRAATIQTLGWGVLDRLAKEYEKSLKSEVFDHNRKGKSKRGSNNRKPERRVNKRNINKRNTQ